MESSENKQRAAPSSDVSADQLARDMREIAEHVIACCQSTDLLGQGAKGYLYQYSRPAATHSGEAIPALGARRWQNDRYGPSPIGQI